MDDNARTAGDFSNITSCIAWATIRRAVRGTEQYMVKFIIDNATLAELDARTEGR